MNKFLKNLKVAFFQWLSTGLFVLLITSCVSYYPSSYRAENVLAVTKAGDTIKLPISELRRQYNYNTYSDWQFYYGNNSWYYWSDWRLRYPSYSIWYNDWYRPYWYQSRPYYQPKTRNVPRYIPREQPERRTPTKVIQSNRGRNNQSQVRRPQYNRATPSPTTSNRNSTVRRSNNNVRKQN